MVTTDPIADMLTRIRNAMVAKHDKTTVPASKMKKAIAQILLEEGYIRNVEVKRDGAKESLVITLKYGPDRAGVITGLKRISRPGLRIYAGKDEMPKVLGGLGIAVISTSKGVMTDKNARKNGVGGEVLAYIW
ncbi:MAG: 30S ribosomal protein S8 [Christensenellales bacterium]|jgi:small subunit ribosomal protein S8